jgi:hypothetical protein
VNVEVDTGRLSVWTDEAHFDRTAADHDLYVPRFLQEHWRRKDAFSCSPQLPRHLGSDREDWRLRGNEGLKLRVERPRFIYVLLLDVMSGRPNR